MISEQPIAVYVINLDRRPDRLEALASQLDAASVNWRRFAAIDAQNLDSDTLNASFRQVPTIHMSPGAKACSLSHIEVLKLVAAGPEKAAVILEDDVLISPGLRELVHSDDWLPDTTDLIDLEAKLDKPSSKLQGATTLATIGDNRVVRHLYSMAGGTGGYLVTRDGAQKILDNLGIMSIPIDHLLFNPGISAFPKRLKVSKLQPAIVGQQKEIFLTDIQNGEDRRESLFYSLRRGWFEIRAIPKQLWLLVTGRARLMKTDFRH